MPEYACSLFITTTFCYEEFSWRESKCVPGGARISVDRWHMPLAAAMLCPQFGKISQN